MSRQDSTGGVSNPLDRVSREVSAIARMRDPDSVSWRALRSSIIQAADYLREKTAQTKPPIRLAQIARLRMIKGVEFILGDAGSEAHLVTVDDGFLIRLAKDRARVRQRVTVAHEIAHTFFYELRDGRPCRLLTRNQMGRYSLKEEDMCQAFARELLLPRELVVRERAVWSGGSLLGFLKYLAGRFDVSLELVTVRWLWDLAGLERIIAVFYESREGQSGARPRAWRSRRARNLKRGESQLLRRVKDAMYRADRDELEELKKDLEVEGGSLEWEIGALGEGQRLIGVLVLRT